MSVVYFSIDDTLCNKFNGLSLARHGWHYQNNQQRESGHQQTRPWTSTGVDQPCCFACSAKWLHSWAHRPWSCPPNPRSWWMDQWQRTASSGWERSKERWQYQCDQECTISCHHSSPTALLCSPVFMKMRIISKIKGQSVKNVNHLATRSTQRTIRRDCDSVEVTRVVIMVLLQTAVGQVPDLDHAVPATWNNDGVVVVGWEPHAGNPVSVAFLLQTQKGSLVKHINELRSTLTNVLGKIRYRNLIITFICPYL